MSWRPVFAVVAIACSHAAPAHDDHPVDHRPRTLTIIGTNDLHGALDRLPLFAGFVANVRAERAADGGGVLLLDGGDLFQGTLESNLGEGTDVVRAYNALHYDAAAVGNHEFDYGPVGPAITAKPGEDPRGALKARIAEAKFAFLAANLIDDATGALPAWPNLAASKLIDVAGIKVGIVGASTKDTPTTTMPANFKGIAIKPTAIAIADEARALRSKGADLVVVVAHIGSNCKDTKHADAVATCDHKAELWKLIGELPKGAVDVIVGGHTHAAVAHVIDGVATIESYSSGRAFGRVDLQIAEHKVVKVEVHPPEVMCPLDANRDPIPVADCHPGPYAGKPVVADPAIQKIVDDALVRAGPHRTEKLGVTLTATVTRAYGTESVEGDLLTELMLEAQPDGQLALTNGGGLRQDLPAGELTYGQLFAALPFDNKFAIVDIEGKQIRKLLTTNLRHGAGIFSWAGLTATATCTDGKLAVDIRVGGKPLDDGAHYKLVTSDFLSSGGDGALGRLQLAPSAIRVTEVIIREAIADLLRARKGTIDPAHYLGANRRLVYPGKRPVKCNGAPPEEEFDHD